MKIISFTLAPNGDIFALMDNGTLWQFQDEGKTWFPLPLPPKGPYA